MANEVWVKSQSTITAQDNSSYLDETYDPNSGSYTGGTPTVINQSSGENAAGAEYLNLEFFVDDAPATAGGAEIWYSESEDGTNYTQYKYSHTIGDAVGTTDDLWYDAGLFYLKSKYTKLAINAVDYDIIDCTLYATPKLMEVQ